VDRREFLQLGGTTAVAGLLGCDTPEASGDGEEEWTAVPETSSLPEIAPITSNEEHYDVAYLGMMDVDPDTWVFEVYLQEELIGSFDYSFLEGLETRDREHTLQCIESNPNKQLMSNAVWSGLPLTEVLEAAGIEVPSGSPGAFLKFSCADGYATGLPTEYLQELPLWLVWRMNGEILPKKHGFPARVLTPGLFGWKNPKQPVSLTFQGEEFVAPWEGWSTDGSGAPQEPWSWFYELQGLIVTPDATDVVQVGDSVVLLGKAHAGGDPVSWVGLSADGGQNFGDAKLTYSPGAHRWTLFRAQWAPQQAGTYLLVVACRTESGAETNPEEKDGAVPYNGGMALLIDVQERNT